MRRHETDYGALVAGVLFLLLGGVYLVASYSDLDVDTRWIAPTALVCVGVAGIAATLTRGRSQSPADTPAPEDVGGAGDGTQEPDGPAVR